MSVGRSSFSIMAVVATLILAAWQGASFAREPHRARGSAPQAASGVDLQQQVGDADDEVEDTADQAGDQVDETTGQVDDTADQAGDQVEDTADDAADQVGGAADGAGDAVNGAASQFEEEVSDASGGALDQTGNVEGDAGSSLATNSNPATGSDAEEIAGAGNDVSGEKSDEAGASEAAQRPGLLSLTGTQLAIAAGAVGLLLVVLGIILLSVRRGRRRASTA
jgi:hypothetical protein